MILKDSPIFFVNTCLNKSFQGSRKLYSLRTQSTVTLPCTSVTQPLDEHLYVSVYSETKINLYKKRFFNVLQGNPNVIQFYIPAIEEKTEGKT